MSTPLSNTAPARTRGTRCGPFTARQRCWADSMSLKAIASPAAREPAPLVTRVRSRTVEKVDSRLLCQVLSRRLLGGGLGGGSATVLVVPHSAHDPVGELTLVCSSG